MLIDPFEREGTRYKFGDHFTGENRLIASVTRPNALFLSTSAQHNHKQTEGLFSWFRSIQLINVKDRGPGRASMEEGSLSERWLQQTFLQPGAGVPQEERERRGNSDNK